MSVNPVLSTFLESDIVLANKGSEIMPGDLNMKNVAPYKSYKIGACGRENAMSGCDGTFELWDKVANVPVAKIMYYSPHGSSYNQFRIDCTTKGWTASQTGAYFGRDAPLGAITVTVSTN